MGVGDMRCNACGQEWDACRCKTLGQAAAEEYLKNLKTHFIGQTMTENDWATFLDSCVVLIGYRMGKQELQKVGKAIEQVGRKRALELLMEV